MPKFLRRADPAVVTSFACIVILLLLGSLYSRSFLSPEYLLQQLKVASFLGVIATGMMLVILLGQIDLSVPWSVATGAMMACAAAAYGSLGVALAIPFGVLCGVAIGLVNGIGVGVFRVHPLIMTLGTSLIGTGFLQVYQRTVIASGAKIPDFLNWLGTGVTYGFPNALLLFVPVAVLIVFMLNRTGFGRLLYAVGDNERAARLSGVRYWQVITALYVLSSLLAGITGLLYIGLIKAPSLSLAEPLVLPSVAAAVIGGTSIFGGRGGYTGTIIGALILTVLTTLLTILQMPEGGRRILFGFIVLFVTAAYLRIVEDR
ncbi:MAG: ABC transporter permease [Mesorhizobium sp.]|nr:MAG: ABC transporter permease [Mesorhizobium sp.]